MTKQRKSQMSEEGNQDKPQVFSVSKENGSFKLERRDFVKMSAIASTAVWLTSCVPGQTQQVIEIVETVKPTDLPTSTPRPTSTKKPTNTPTATPVIVVGNVNTSGVNLRTGPGTFYQAIGPLAANVPVKIVAQSSDGLWFKVIVNISDLPNLAGAPITKNGSMTQLEGWIKKNLVTVTAGSVDELPTESAPPTPTALPNQKPTGSEGITYEYTDPYGVSSRYTLPCGSPIPQGAVCVCNCVAVCSCNGYVAPTAPSCSCNTDTGGQICTCNMVSYWYPN